MRGLMSRLRGQPGVQRSRLRLRGDVAHLTRADALEIFSQLRQMDTIARLTGNKRLSQKVRAEAKEVQRRLLEEHPAPVTRARARG